MSGIEPSSSSGDGRPRPQHRGPGDACARPVVAPIVTSRALRGPLRGTPPRPLISGARVVAKLQRQDDRGAARVARADPCGPSTWAAAKVPGRPWPSTRPPRRASTSASSASTGQWRACARQLGPWAPGHAGLGRYPGLPLRSDSLDLMIISELLEHLARRPTWRVMEVFAGGSTPGRAAPADDRPIWPPVQARGRSRAGLADRCSPR